MPTITRVTLEHFGLMSFGSAESVISGFIILDQLGCSALVRLLTAMAAFAHFVKLDPPFLAHVPVGLFGEQKHALPHDFLSKTACTSPALAAPAGSWP